MSILRTGDERHHGNSLRRISPSHRHTAQKKRKEGAKESGPLQIPHTCTLDHFKVVLFLYYRFQWTLYVWRWMDGWMDGKEKPSKMRRDPFFFFGYLFQRVSSLASYYTRLPPPPLSLCAQKGQGRPGPHKYIYMGERWRE